MLGDKIGEKSQQVAHHLNLAIAIRASANADGGDTCSLGDQLGKGCRNRFQNYGEGPCLLQGLGVIEQAHRHLRGLAYHLEAAELVHRLRGEPDMTLNRNAALDKLLHLISDCLSTLQLHRLCSCLLNKAGGIAQCILDPGVVGHEGHIAYHQRPLRAPHHRLGVVDHLIHGHGDSGLIAQNYHAQAIANQDHGHSHLVD